MSHKYNQLEYLILIIVVVVFFLLYLTQLTQSGLWYDEATEYFFSKYLTGEIPSSDDTSNMYERILGTYQPPLYNIVMYFWLLVLDTEWWFRLFGVIITFIGSFGIYKGIKLISNWKWGLSGMIMYLMTSSIMYYALECGEYSLLLCMESWALYFFLRCFSSSQLKQSNSRNIIGFILFSCLSIYSQYGAVFFVFPLFLIMLGKFIWKREFKSMKQLVICSLIALILAGFPLWHFFVRIQMERQDSLSVSHYPVFVKNFIYSYFVGFAYNILWIFYWSFKANEIVKYFRLLVILIVGTLIIIGVIKKRDFKLNALLGGLFISWTLFFILTSCSFYGHNCWDVQIGFNTVFGGNRYILYIVPLMIATCIYGLYVFTYNVSMKIIKYLLTVLAFIYVTCGVYTLHKGIIKSDTREAVEAWYDNKCYTKKTVVQEWFFRSFLFYFHRLPIYNAENSSRIIETGIWMRTQSKKEIISHFIELGILNLNEFYYVGNSDLVKEIFHEAGFSISNIWKGDSSIWYCKKINNYSFKRNNHSLKSLNSHFL